MDEFVGTSGIVTGGGSGIGRAVCLLLAAEGGNVLAVDINEAGAEQTARLGADLPGRIVPHKADIARTDQIKGYVDRCLDEFGSLFFFCNSAGIGGAHKKIVEMSEDEWDLAMNVNLRSQFVALKYVLPVMQQQGKGAVVNVGSVRSYRSAVRRCDYVASKHGLLGLTMTAAAECLQDGIRINLVCPGATDTPLQNESERLIDPSNPSFERNRLEKATPLGRYGTPAEVADAIAFLLSPKRPPMLNGTVVTVDGGKAQL